VHVNSTAKESKITKQMTEEVRSNARKSRRARIVHQDDFNSSLLNVRANNNAVKHEH
jgi:hypothetical protein